MTLDELWQRMTKASDELMILAEKHTAKAENGPYHDSQENFYEARRLLAKAQGVRLALSYLDEYMRQDEGS